MIISPLELPTSYRIFQRIILNKKVRSCVAVVEKTVIVIRDGCISPITYPTRMSDRLTCELTHAN